MVHRRVRQVYDYIWIPLSVLAILFLSWGIVSSSIKLPTPADRYAWYVVLPVIFVSLAVIIYVFISLRCLHRGRKIKSER